MNEYLADVGRVLWQWSTWVGAGFVLILAMAVLGGFLQVLEKPKPKPKQHNLDENEIADRLRGHL